MQRLGSSHRQRQRPHSALCRRSSGDGCQASRGHCRAARRSRTHVRAPHGARVTVLPTHGPQHVQRAGRLTLQVERAVRHLTALHQRTPHHPTGWCPWVCVCRHQPVHAHAALRQQLLLTPVTCVVRGLGLTSPCQWRCQIRQLTPCGLLSATARALYTLPTASPAACVLVQ